MVNACASRDYTENVVGVCFVGQDVTSEKVVMDKFIRLQGDYKAIIQCLNPLIPPYLLRMKTPAVLSGMQPWKS